MYISTIPYTPKQNFVSFSSQKLSDSGFVSKADLLKEIESGLSVEEISRKYKTSVPRLLTLAKVFGLFQKLKENPKNQADINIKIAAPKKTSAQNQINLDVEIPKLIEQNATIEQMQKTLGVKKYVITKWIKINTPNGLRALKKERMRKIYDSDLSNKELAQLMGVPQRNVTTTRPKYGVFMSKRKEEKTLEQIKNALNCSVKIKDIAKEANVHAQTCRKYIQKFNLMQVKMDNLKEFIFLRIKDGKGKYAIAKELQISESALVKLLDKLNIKDAFEQHKHNLQEQVQQLRQKGLKIEEIAQKLGISSGTVRNYIKK